MTTNGVAMITGAGGRLGRVITDRLCRAGLACGLIGRRAKPLGEAAAPHGSRCLVLPGDVRDPAFMEDATTRLITRFGRLDVAVHAAALLADSAGHEVSPWEHFDCVLRTNISGAAILGDIAASRMTAGGVVVLVGSAMARHPTPDALAYGASKAALAQLTASLDARYRPRGVRAVCVAPGPLQRSGACEDVAEAIIYLASRWGRRVRGTVLYVDGGESAHGKAIGSARR